MLPAPDHDDASGSAPDRGQMRRTSRGRRWTRRALLVGAAMPVLAGSIGVGVSAATPTLSTSVWSGAGAPPSWSTPGNWETNTVPTNGSALTFPALGPQCSQSSVASTCYVSTNDLGDLSIPSVTLDGTSSYLIGGGGITLGSGGVTDTAPSSAPAANNTLALPITLGSGQTWSLTGSSALTLTDTGGVTGAQPLNVSLSGGPSLDLGADNEVGAVTISGSSANTGAAAPQNGWVTLGGTPAALNSVDGNPVQVTDAGFGGAGAVGPLTTTGAEVSVGLPGTNPGVLTANSATFDAATHVDFSVPQFGSGVGTDYSQLAAGGAVDLGGAGLNITTGIDGGQCFDPPLGQTYTIVSATGGVSGEFSDGSGPIGNGGTTPITVPQGCAGSSNVFQIYYNSTSVTATVVGPTTTSVSVNPATVAPGGSVTYSATVTGPAEDTSDLPAGNVTFIAAPPLGLGSDVTVCNATIVNGEGSCTATNAPSGADVVTGIYGGDSQYVGSAGSANLQVGTPTSTSVSVTPSSVTAGQSVLYSATVTGSGGTPSGTVTFAVDGSTICGGPQTLSGGTAACHDSNAPVGTDTVTATYSGDATFAPSIGSTTLDVSSTTGVPTTTSVTVNPTSVTVGQNVTYSASVAGSGGPPTGTVTFTIGATTLCGGPQTLSAGAASCTDSGAPGGSDFVVATYSGDSTFAGSSGVTALTVVRKSTSTHVTVNPTSATKGQSVTFSATVTGSGGTPTGTVTFTVGATTLCGGPQTLSGGSASCTDTNAPVGVETVTATYSGDTTFAPSAGNAPLTVTNPDGVSTSTSVTVSPTTVSRGQTVTYTATVTGTGGPPTGTVAFTIGGSPLCTATLSGGTGSCTASSAPMGTDTVVGTYSGDETFAGSTGSTTLTVHIATTNTTPSVSLSTVIFGHQITYSATVTSLGSGTPTGTVTFAIGTTPLCTATLSSASGSCTSPAAPVGSDTVTATYSGDTNFAGSQGTVALTVTPFVFTSTTTNISVNPSTVRFSQTVTYSATVTGAEGTPSGTVVFTVGSTTLCTAHLSGGAGTCTATNAPQGSDSVKGTYSGDSLYLPSSDTAGLMVNPPIATNTTISSAPNPVLQGNVVQYSVTVTAVPGNGAPPGTVSVGTGSTTMCTIPLTLNNSTGVSTGSCDATDTPAGADVITGQYSGGGGFGVSSGTTQLLVLVSDHGYWIDAADGGVFSYGDAHFYGSEGAKHLNSPVVSMQATPDGGGYWLAAADGGIFSFGDARFYGSPAAHHLNDPIVGMARTWDGHGYWLVASDGGVFTYGDANFYGSTGSIHLNKPIVAMASTPDGKGYWLVATDGGVFSFGDAKFYGSTGSIHLNNPIVGAAATTDGKGYWMVASDGGLFSFGDAQFYGSAATKPHSQPIVGMAPTLHGHGYWMVTANGQVFNFGDANYFGSTVSINLNKPVVGNTSG